MPEQPACATSQGRLSLAPAVRRAHTIAARRVLATAVRRTVATAAAALLAAGTVVTGLPAVGVPAAARAAVGQDAAGPAGPAQISPLGHPRLCWEAWSNGSAVTLEPCRPALQAQQWTFTGGVLMNGDGYCLQNGGAAQAGDRLFLSFSGQCAGAPSQRWAFTGAASLVENTPAGVCAYARGGLVAGAVIVGHRCGSASTWSSWSLGTSDLVLAPAGHAAGPAALAGGQAGAHRAFSAQVTVSNGARAMTAYGASVTFRAPAGLRITKLSGGGSLSGWACAVRAVRCRGDLAGGSRGVITIAGTVTGRPAADTITARATVTRTNQSRHRALAARVPVRVYTAAASGPGGPGPAASRTVVFALLAASLLLVLGIVLAVVTRRRPGPQAPPPPGSDGVVPAPRKPAGRAAAGRHAR